MAKITRLISIILVLSTTNLIYASAWPTEEVKAVFPVNKLEVIESDLAAIKDKMDLNESKLGENERVLDRLIEEVVILKTENEKLVLALNKVTTILEDLSEKTDQKVDQKVEANKFVNQSAINGSLVNQTVDAYGRKGRYVIQNVCHTDRRGNKYCVPTTVFVLD